ncbi:MAG: class I SAM-dependent rRNA methyltransferase [Candidatus Scalindua sp. AMX11]|nr:MAG: class I SAM-dependent rRNA methyltransferase [Candidatus Scalindua sp.]NOG85219.1 class I SAM-dependent rRNA methyltransferase [Planctomycetota bacterium]RZV66135.1 MAG: class I SAM-dependent rRNA methyltransferase [Candidatus Scalindua sp. SCAELEC01]TDE63556.1 MAG: class I SAM-dependent rRNA methyltransferase [Candidatus Scalindua sp. AMX11]GJQ60864.1 MAG: SAM-dependent methyltransferase [Candidatus Scalindua sp.]
MKLNETATFQFKILSLLPPLSLRIKEGLPRLVLDRLPDHEQYAEPGWLKIEDGEGVMLSWGFVDIENNAVHLISSSEADPITDITSRFEKAINKRSVLETLKGEVVRLVNGTGDNLSGFTLDSYGSTLVLSLESEALVHCLRDETFAFLRPEHIVLKVRGKGREFKGKISQHSFYGKSGEEKICVRESGISYLVHPMGSLDTGLFFDLRGVRKEFAEHAEGKSVLNLFSYTGAFSLAAAKKGARQVVSVDTSADCQKWARENFRLNNLDPEDERFRFIKENVFHHLDKLTKRSETYERIILDPPARSMAGTGRFFLKSDLHKLVSSCLRLLPPKGRLLVTDNTLQGTKDKLAQRIKKGSEVSNIPCSIVKVFDPEPDFPVHPLWPKGYGVIAMEVERG